MSRTGNAVERIRGKVEIAVGRLAGKGRMAVRGRARHAKSDLKDDGLDAKKAARKLKR